MAALGVDLRVAELGDVQVSRVAWAERTAAQEGLDEVRRRRVVLVPREPADLRQPLALKTAGLGDRFLGQIPRLV
jgi:hypothetical protein